MNAVHYIVFGGGCYGSFYVGQLLKAEQRGRTEITALTVLDRDPQCRVARELSHPHMRIVTEDWLSYGPTLLSLPEPAHLVPAPIAPHVIYEWFADALGATRKAYDGPVPVGLPFSGVVRQQSLALSHAPGMCPIHCIEPRKCPLTRDVRDWEMDNTVRHVLNLEAIHVETFICRHHVYGVGTIPVPAIQAGLDRLHTLSEKQTVAIATISACHGLIDLLELSP